MKSEGPLLPLPQGMDKSRIIRKRSKTSKHGHENQKSTKPKPKIQSLSQFSSTKAILAISESHLLLEREKRKTRSLSSRTNPDLHDTELADRSISKPIGIAEDVYVTEFLKDQSCIDRNVYKGEITLRVGKEAITFNLDQTSRYTANYNHMTTNQIDVIEMACEEYSQEVLGFSNVILSGNPTPYYDQVDDPTSPKVDPTYYDLKGDILILEAIHNNEPSPHLQGNYFPETQKDLKICEANNEKSLVNEHPEVELKDLPPHLEYAFLEGNDKLPVIIEKDLKNEEKAALIEVLKSHKRAIAWKLFDIKGIDPEFCTHKILMEEDYESRVQHQRRVNPKIHDVIKKEVENFLTPD
ncbi:hypothetical protein Tco_0758423 [Tanacetum coccineum]